MDRRDSSASPEPALLAGTQPVCAEAHVRTRFGSTVVRDPCPWRSCGCRRDWVPSLGRAPPGLGTAGARGRHPRGGLSRWRPRSILPSSRTKHVERVGRTLRVEVAAQHTREGEVMSKFAVVVFEDEKKAYEGLHALQELHAEGSLTVWGTDILRRDAERRVSIVKRDDQGPLGTGLGMLAGGLVGLFGGPVGEIGRAHV